MPAIGAHELPSASRSLLPVRGLAVAAAAGGGAAELLQLDRLRPAPLAEPGGPPGPPNRKLWHEDLVPEERYKQDKDASQPRAGDFEAEVRREELGEDPEGEEWDDEPREHGGDATGPSLDHAEYAHYPETLEQRPMSKRQIETLEMEEWGRKI